MINGKGELTMRRFKRMVALIMTVMCIFTLTGCATDAEKLVGTWKGEISVNDVMDNTNVASGNLDILLLKQFIDFSEMYIAFDMTFNEDGTYYAKVDEASVQKFLDAVLVEIEKNLYDIVEAEIGKTGVNISESLKRIGYQHRGFNLYFENLKPRWNMVLKTEQTPIEIFNSFEKQTRTKIRNSLRKGVEIYKGTKDDLKMFYQMINKKHTRKYDYYLNMYDIFGRFNMFDVYFARINTEVFLKNSKLLYEHELQKNKKLADALQRNIRNQKQKSKLLNRKIESDKLLNSYKNDIVFGTRLYSDRKYIIVASNAIVKYGNEIFFLIDGINYKFKNFNANHLLKWKIIEEYRRQGYTKFHFNGITGDFTKKNKYNGLFIFKKGFNAKVTEYIGEYSLVVNKAKYGLYKSLKPIMNLSMRKD